MNKLCATFLIALLAILMAACSTSIPQPTEDTTYLTPIPEATVFAIKQDGPINTKLEATIIGLKNSMGPHFGFIKLPMVISVDKLTLAEARKRGSNLDSFGYDGKGGLSDVWFLVLEGETQVRPPDPYFTPQPPVHGCLYEVFATNYPINGVVALGGIVCPPKTP